MSDTVATTKVVAGVIEVLTEATVPSGDIDALVHFTIGEDEDTPVRRYSASIDDALSLVPEGVNFHIMRGKNDGCGAMVGEEFASGMTPATTLCAAALMYRLGDDEGTSEGTDEKA